MATRNSSRLDRGIILTSGHPVGRFLFALAAIVTIVGGVVSSIYLLSSPHGNTPRISTSTLRTPRPTEPPTATTSVPIQATSTSIAKAITPETTPPAPHVTAAGTVLGTYALTMSAGYTVPLGPTAPTQSELSSTGMGDLTYNTFAGEATLNSTAQSILYSLPSGTTPTYSGCIDDLDIQQAAGAGTGTSFCLSIKNQSLMDSVTVSYINTSEINPTDVMINVTVWKD
jgi:hypothetical protein